MEVCRCAGVLLWYLLLYSPDFNPIEAFFKDIKTLMRRLYKWSRGNQLTKDEFKDFLREYAEERASGRSLAAIRGHFRAAIIPS